MTLREMIEHGIIIEGEVKYCYYDYEKEVNVTIGKRIAMDKEVRYIYVSEGVLHIEVSNA